MAPYALAFRVLARPICTASPRSPILVLSSRPFFHTSHASYPRVDAQDKDSINTEATEYAKSGTDDDAARQESAAFDPDKTSPEEQRHTAGQGKGDDDSNPLEVSPANPEVSKQRPGQEGGAESSSGSHEESRERMSGGGSPTKAKKTS